MADECLDQDVRLVTFLRIKKKLNSAILHQRSRSQENKHMQFYFQDSWIIARQLCEYGSFLNENFKIVLCDVCLSVNSWVVIKHKV